MHTGFERKRKDNFFNFEFENEKFLTFRNFRNFYSEISKNFEKLK